MKKYFTIFFLLFATIVKGQTPDTAVFIGNYKITLDTVVVGKNLDVARFIQRVKTDTSFYKAFKNLKVVNFKSLNDVRMTDKNGAIKATYFGRRQQTYANNCRTQKILEEQITGNLKDENNNYNYYTAQMYASLFFTEQPVCNDNNIIGDVSFNVKNKSGLDKHKEQLKILFFNPGKRIPGIPFLSNKTGIYDADMAEYYDMQIGHDIFNGTDCYFFKQKVKEDNQDDVVVDEMTTWFDAITYEIKGRNYSLNYSAGVYDFDVKMEVVISKIGQYLVPTVMRYNGNWKALFKPRERGVFVATLYDFN
jgi:hypothetical protein